MKECTIHGTHLHACTEHCEHIRSGGDTMPSPSSPGACASRPKDHGPCERNLGELQCAYCGRPVPLTAPTVNGQPALIPDADLTRWALDAQRVLAGGDEWEPNDQESARRIQKLCMQVMLDRDPVGQAVVTSKRIRYLMATDPILRELDKQNENQRALIGKLQELCQRWRKWRTQHALTCDSTRSALELDLETERLAPEFEPEPESE